MCFSYVHAEDDIYYLTEDETVEYGGDVSFENTTEENVETQESTQADQDPEESTQADPTPEESTQADPAPEESTKADQDPEESTQVCDDSYTISTESDNQQDSSEMSPEENLSPADYSEITSAMQILHEDLQKLMISIWCLFGLLLGTKLIRGLFGYG